MKLKTLCVSVSLWLLISSAYAQPLEPLTATGGLGWEAEKQGQFVMAIATDRQGGVWAGTEDQGVWRYSPQTRKWRQFTVKDGLGDDNGYALACDRLGRVWVGHLNHGVSVWNGAAWKNYGPLDGLPGERVFAITTCPTDGNVWIATSGGLARYSLATDKWSTFTRAEGLPSDQIAALAFDAKGNLLAGTQCDGLALASAADNYQTWRSVRGPDMMPGIPTGKGLSSNLVNDVLAARDGVLYAATTVGLASSTDGGQNWGFVRGANWAERVRGLWQGPAATAVPLRGEPLAEDWVTSLAEDKSGQLWLGYRQKGYEAREPQSNERILWSGEDPRNAAPNDLVRAIGLVPGAPPLIVRYGGDLGGLGAAGRSRGGGPPPGAASPAVAPPLPSSAPAPDATALDAMRAHVAAFDKAAAPGTGAYLGEDWTTQGDWVGRYGRDYAMLSGMMSPMNHELTWDADRYGVDSTVGPHFKNYRDVFSWIQWLKTDIPKVLYDPILGHRRQGEWNDGSFNATNYPMTWDGPDLWVSARVPEGPHRISLYFFNKDGHATNNRYRDYALELKPPAETADAALALPTLARARVRDFWGGVYEQFAVQGPGQFWVKIGRNASYVTMLQGVFLDNLAAPANLAPKGLPWLAGVFYDPPTPPPAATEEAAPLAAARALWSALDAAQEQDGAAILQRPYRLAAYRAALAANAPPALLANWRWRLALWQERDRAEFQATMQKAHAALLVQNPELKKQDK